MKLLLGLLATVSLVACALVAFYYFWGSITMQQYKTILFAASILYFLFATLWATRSNQQS
jgi:O-antigen ligase